MREQLPERVLPVDLDTLGEVFLPELTSRLLPMLSQTIVLELHVARLRDRLEGNTPEERWQHFTRRLGRTGAIVALLEEYPVLARQIALCIDQWVTARVTFITRLCADWPALCATFSPTQDPGVLIRLVDNAGDTHHGDSVIIAEFRSGLRLVYKPRSMAVDVHFQQLLTWLNARGAYPAFPICRVLNREAYGWVEFVVAVPCMSTDELRRFYRRSGGYLALLYTLCATDMHAENLVAVGEFPVLVDLEALFHPNLLRLGAECPDDVVALALEKSVLRVGLLPERRWPSTESDGVDLSGLSGAPGQLSPTPVRTLDAVGADRMRFVRKRVPLPGSKNRPSLLGADVDVLDYTNEIATGFEIIYRLLMRHRAHLLAPGGPLDGFADAAVRVILRDTYTYARLLQESFHPDVLRDALDRDCLFDQLWKRAEHQPSFIPVVIAERADLSCGDLPRFTTHAGSRDLWTSPTQRLTDFFAVPGLTLARRRLQQLSEEDLARQLWFIRASFATLARGEESVSATAGHSSVESDASDAPMGGTTVDRAGLIAAARRVGDRLATLALVGTDQVSWLGITLTPRRECALAPLGADLYDGIPGVVLFLAFLGALTEGPSYTQLAESALQVVRRGLVEDRELCVSIGGFTGWGGIIYCLTQLGVLWDAPELLSEAETIVEHLPAHIERDEELDVLGGAAGCVGALLGLHHWTASDRVLNVAIQCGDRLIARARPMQQGIGWCTGGRPHALTGFSHGAAGMAWALLALAARTGVRRFQTTALDALAYERSRFVTDAGNWPDLRRTSAAAHAEQAGRHAFLTAWCHGAPGIGLARLHSLQHLDDDVTRAEIDVALHTTWTRGFGRNHCLCHGDLGNIELLIEAGQRLDDAQWSHRAQTRARAILEDGDRRGWVSGAPFSVESPGLMTGLAGIGYGLLRLAAPAVVPSVLTLAPVEIPARVGTASCRA